MDHGPVELALDRRGHRQISIRSFPSIYTIKQKLIDFSLPSLNINVLPCHAWCVIRKCGDTNVCVEKYIYAYTFLCIQQQDVQFTNLGSLCRNICVNIKSGI